MNYLLTLDGLANNALPAANAGDFCAVFVSAPANGAAVQVNGLPAQTGDLFICQMDGTPAATPANWLQQSILLMPLPLLAPYLPDYFQSVQEYQALLATEQVTTTQLQADLAQLAANCFVQTCDLNRLAQFEGIFKISAAPTDEQTFRRKRVLNRFAQTPPYTMPYLQQLIENMVGAGNAVVLVNSAIGYNYILGTNGWFLGSWTAGIHAGAANLPFVTPGFQLYIGFVPTSTSYENEILATVAAIKPCHMEATACTLVFNTVASGFTTTAIINALVNGTVEIPNVIHVGSRDNLGRIPITYTVNYDQVTDGIISSVALTDASYTPLAGLSNGGLSFQIPVGGSITIMHLITIPD